MATKDLHEKPFDKSTIAKLEIFEDYAQVWLPTFIMQGLPNITIFDFFAGTGYDKNGVAGSPIRILSKIKEQIPNIIAKGIKITVYLNEFEQKKFVLLKAACLRYLEDNEELKDLVDIRFFNQDFEEIFPVLLPAIQQCPSLVYLDQNGMKFLSDKYFLALEKTKRTDFLYFVSSSFILRFGDSSEFRMHLNIDLSMARQNPYKYIHRSILDQLRSKLPANTRLKLYPFSLKKGSNIYGIIFGASDPRAVEKFLGVAWKRNSTNGQANFDIDDDMKKGQLNIFGGQSLTKIQGFQDTLRRKILCGELSNNFDVFNFVQDEGHIGSHAADCLKAMKKNGEITFEGTSPLITYEKVYKLKRKVHFKLAKKLSII